MSLLGRLSALTIYQVLGDRAASLARFLGDQLSDNSQRLERALRLSGERAWRTLEVALAGSSWWQTCKNLLTPREEQTLAAHINTFLASMPATQASGDAN